jgi:hypothetical protein
MRESASNFSVPFLTIRIPQIIELHARASKDAEIKKFESPVMVPE